MSVRDEPICSTIASIGRICYLPMGVSRLYHMTQKGRTCLVVLPCFPSGRKPVNDDFTRPGVDYC